VKLLIVGQAPSRAMSPGDRPFEGTRALTLLAKYAGVTPRERLYDLADFVNCISEYPGPALDNDKYDAFPLEAARAGALLISAQIYRERYDTVVTLGSAVSKVFGKKDRHKWFEPQPMQWWGRDPRQDAAQKPAFECRLFFSPHPGGTSMWWNDPKNRAAGTRFFTNLFAAQDPTRRTTVGLPPGSDRRIQL